jgi:hypothetical protein
MANDTSRSAHQPMLLLLDHIEPSWSSQTLTTM